VTCSQPCIGKWIAGSTRTHEIADLAKQMWAKKVTGVNHSMRIDMGGGRTETIPDLIETGIKVRPGQVVRPWSEKTGASWECWSRATAGATPSPHSGCARCSPRPDWYPEGEGTRRWETSSLAR
jgi:hypothetical protein